MLKLPVGTQGGLSLKGDLPRYRLSNSSRSNVPED